MPYHNGMIRAQGDPGFFSFLGKALGTAARLVPGPIGAIGGALLPTFTQERVARLPTGPVRLPPRGTGREFIERGFTVDECPPKKKRRRIDPLNMKALRRANTRQRAFLRAVDRTLKTMPTKGSVQRRRRKISGAVK